MVMAFYRPMEMWVWVFMEGVSRVGFRKLKLN